MEKNVLITEKQRELKERLVSLMTKKSLRPAEIARITGRSEGTVSELLRDKKVFSDKLLNVIYESLKDYMGDDRLVLTRQYNKIWNIAKSGKQVSDMRLVVGNTGIGKSVVLKKFAEETECCYYIKIDRKGISWRQFLQKVCETMGIRLDGRKKRPTASYLLDKIVSFCEANADRNVQLIIDESEFAHISFFKDIKGLFTATEGLLSILISGITSITDKIAKMAGLEMVSYRISEDSDYRYSWRPTKENSNIYTTFARRISVFRIENISGDDISFFCAQNGVKDKKVLELAASRWWNYDEASRALKRAQRMNLSLSEITVKEFELL